MATISVQQCIGKGYNNAWWTNCPARYRCFEGARSTKKSVNIGGYEPIFKIIADPNRNIIMCRKDDTNNSTSTYPNIVSMIYKLGLAPYFIIKKSPAEIIYRPTGQKIIFKGCNNPTAITSTKFTTGELTDIYFEEASELESYEDFRQIDGSVRSQSGEGLQITFLMNGWDKKSWIYEIFWKDRLEDDYEYLENHDYADYYDPNFSLGQDSKGLYLHKSTFRINEFRSPYKDESMAELKLKALEIYKVEGLGMWGNNSSATYPYWNSSLIKPHNILLSEPLSIFSIGIDIGMGNGEGKIIKDPDRYRSAMTMQLVGISSDYSKIKCIDEYFFSNQNQIVKKGAPEIAHEMIQKIKEWIDRYKSHPVLMKGTICCYVDSADSGGFRTVLQAKAMELGVMNIRFIASTKNKIQSRVDFVNLLMAFGEFEVCDLCKNLAREIGNARQAEDGRCREDVDDHAINANEYAWIPLLPKIKRYKDFKEH